MADFVGYCTLTVVDPELDLTFPLNVFYPTATPARPATVGMYQLEVAPSAPARAGLWPVVLHSHGTGGSGLAYRTLAHYLARHGYVVALPKHPRNNRDDNRWADSPRNLVARPRHLQLALTTLLANPDLGPVLGCICN